MKQLSEAILAVKNSEFNRLQYENNKLKKIFKTLLDDFAMLRKDVAEGQVKQTFRMVQLAQRAQSKDFGSQDSQANMSILEDEKPKQDTRVQFELYELKLKKRRRKGEMYRKRKLNGKSRAKERKGETDW